MVIKFTDIYHSRALQNLPKFGIFGLKTNHLATLVATDGILSNQKSQFWVNFGRVLQWKMLIFS
jgi:hypothetical protein